MPLTPPTHLFATCFLAALTCLSAGGSLLSAADAPFDPARFEVAPLAAGLVRPMELEVAPDGRVFFIELAGQLKIYDPRTEKVELAGEVRVTTEQENGLIGLALDPNFAQNHWLYLQYSPPDFPGQHISRFTLVDGKLDPASEKLLLKFEEQRQECCHHAGSMEFDPQGNLLIGTGDNTHPGGDAGGYAPIDERPGRGPFDAQRSAGNAKNYSGKILRIKPTADGKYEIPPGNLFPADGSQGAPEIYVMGCRNPWRINVDARTGFLYWGDVGPDAHGDGPRGPRGYDEINQARQAGNFGWPFFIGKNFAYHDVDFAAGTVGATFDLAGPKNDSPHNNGPQILPPPQPALIYYPYGGSAEFPQLGSGGRTACAGPVYHFDPALASPTKLPAEFDKVLFIYDWERRWIKAVHLTDDSQVEKIEPFLPNQPFIRPIDLCFGPEGALYLLEYGSSWGVNPDSRLVRIDYYSGNRPPLARAAAANATGREPLEVAFSSAGTLDKDAGDVLQYEWRAVRAAETPQAATTLSREPNPKFTFEQPGVYNVELIVTDAQGAQARASVLVLVGNATPRIELKAPRDGDFFEPGQPIPFQVKVNDFEDGTSDWEEAEDSEDLDLLDPAAPSRVAITGQPLAQAPGGVGDEGANDPPGLKLMKRSDCFNCHAVDQPRVGPPLVSIAEKYRPAPTLDATAQRVLAGSTGVWGKIPMIPHPQHSLDEAKQMVEWIYSLTNDRAVQVANGFVGTLANPAAEKPLGFYRVLASYTDRGAGDLPPLAAQAEAVLRSRRVEAEQADAIHGPRILDSGTAQAGRFAGSINDGHFLRFNNFPLDRARQVVCRVSSAGAGGKIEFRADAPNGELLGEVEVPNNGAWENWYDRTVELKPSPNRRDLYVVFVHPGNQALMNLDALYFPPAAGK